jgi:hypothetical protein
LTVLLRGKTVNIGKTNDIGYNANPGGFYGEFFGRELRLWILYKIKAEDRDGRKRTA